MKDGDYVADGGPVLVACGQGKSMYDVKGCMSSWVLVGGGGGGDQPDAVREKMAASGGAGGGGGGGGKGELFQDFGDVHPLWSGVVVPCMVDASLFSKI